MAENIELLKQTYTDYLGINARMEQLYDEKRTLGKKTEVQNKLVEEYFQSNAEDTLAVHHYFLESVPDDDFFKELYLDPKSLMFNMKLRDNALQTIQPNIDFLPARINDGLKQVFVELPKQEELNEAQTKQNITQINQFLSKNLPSLKEYEAHLRKTAEYKDKPLPDNVLNLASSEQFNFTLSESMFLGINATAWFANTLVEKIPNCKNAYELCNTMSGLYDTSLGVIQRPVVSKMDKSWESVLNVEDNNNDKVHRILVFIKGEDHNSVFKDSSSPMRKVVDKLEEHLKFQAKRIELKEPSLDGQIRYHEKLFKEMERMRREFEKEADKDKKDKILSDIKVMIAKMEQPDPDSDETSHASFAKAIDKCNQFKDDTLSQIPEEDRAKHRFELVLVWDAHSRSDLPSGVDNEVDALATPGLMEHSIQLNRQERLLTEKQREAQLKKLSDFKVVEIIYGCQSGGANH